MQMISCASGDYGLDVMVFSDRRNVLPCSGKHVFGNEVSALLRAENKMYEIAGERVRHEGDYVANRYPGLPPWAKFLH